MQIPWVSWRRTMMRTPGIPDKDFDGDLHHPGEGLQWAPQASWRGTTMGTPAILEKLHDGDPNHPGEGP